MEIVMAMVVGGLFASGIYLMLRRSLVKLVLGLALLSQAINLLIFAAGGLTRGRPPLVPIGGTAPSAIHADPLPQALILTAIVISFGVLAFTLVLMHRAHDSLGTDDLHQLRDTDR